MSNTRQQCFFFFFVDRVADRSADSGPHYARRVLLDDWRHAYTVELKHCMKNPYSSTNFLSILIIKFLAEIKSGSDFTRSVRESTANGTRNGSVSFTTQKNVLTRRVQRSFHYDKNHAKLLFNYRHGRNWCNYARISQCVCVASQPVIVFKKCFQESVRFFDFVKPVLGYFSFPFDD